MSSLISPVAVTIIRRHTLKGAMTGKSIFAFSHRHLSAMKMKSVPVTIRKEVITGPELLLPDGIRSKQFRMWGHTGRHKNGAVLFHTFVRAWKYTEPDPLYGKYTTKEWTRYIIECQPDIEPADAFVYRNEAFTLYSKEELERLVGILHGKLFNGFRPGLFILWAYRMEWKELPAWEWNMLKADTHLSFLGISPVRIQTDHKRHIVTIYKKSE